MSEYKHLFFDLDRTLWDFDSNSRDVFQEFFNEHKLEAIITDFDLFVETYWMHNERLWELYREGKMTKEVLRPERFRSTLADFGIDDDELASQFDLYYISNSPLKKKLFPGTIEALDYLSKSYQLHIITNGFKEVQYTKLDNSGLTKYFNVIITSEEIGYQKPRTEIFKYSLSAANAKKKESIMLGDDLKVDILGAKSFGMDQVFVNHKKIIHDESVSFEVFHLEELIKVF